MQERTQRRNGLSLPYDEGEDERVRAGSTQNSWEFKEVPGSRTTW